ncbi:MAG: ABC transporter substrate-binding protein [Actinomycetota bacterium]
MLVVALVLSACTGGVDRAGSTGADAPDALAFADGDGGEVDAASGVVWRLALVAPASRQPSDVVLTDQSSVIVTDLLFDGLTAVGPDGSLVPALATGWEASGDFATWTFTLDPARVTAAEVVAHIDVMRARTDSEAVAPLLDGLVSVVAASDHEVRFGFDSPRAGFPWLASGVGLSVPRAGGEPSSGFVVVDDAASALVLERDPAVAVPGVGRIEVHWADDSARAYEMLTLGLVDVAPVPVAEMADAMDRFGFRPGHPLATTAFVALNPAAATWADLVLVDAVHLSLDHVALAAAAGLAPVDGVVSPALAGYAVDACGAQCGDDPEFARLLVTDPAVGAVPPTLVFGSTQAPGADPLERTVAEALDAAGFVIEHRQLTADELTAGIDAGVVDLHVAVSSPAASTLDAVTLFSAGASGSIGADGLRWAELQNTHRQVLEQGHLVPVGARTSTLVVAPSIADLVVRADGSVAYEAAQ